MMPEGMSALVTVEQLRRNPLIAAELDGGSVVVASTPKGSVVVVNRCPHQQAAMLHEGTLADGALTCPLHGRTFDLEDGRCRDGAGRLTIVPSRVVDGMVWAGPVPVPKFPAF